MATATKAKPKARKVRKTRHEHVLAYLPEVGMVCADCDKKVSAA